MTPQVQIDAMKRVCEELVSRGHANAAHVDDWGKFGNFTLLVTPAVIDRFSTTKLKSTVRKLLPADAHLRATYPPGAHRKTIWSLDVDFQQYYPALNRFESQL